jgi:endonuclease-3
VSENEPETPDIEDAFGEPAKKKRRVVSKAKIHSDLIKSEPLDDALGDLPNPPSKAPRRERKPARSKTDASTGESKIEPPSDWEEMYNLVRQMRAPGGAAHGAAVDTMGCERLADRKASPKDQRFHTLVALMLSSQTKDTVNAVAMKRLQTELPAYKAGAPVGLNLNNMLAVDPKLLNEMIWAVGFHNNKTKYGELSTVCIRGGTDKTRDTWEHEELTHDVPADTLSKRPRYSATSGTATSPTRSRG